jgi:hypothetical protein
VSLAGSVDADHDVGGLDHRIGLLAFFDRKVGDRLVGDRGGDDDAAADVDSCVSPLNLRFASSAGRDHAGAQCHARRKAFPCYVHPDISA